MKTNYIHADRVFSGLVLLHISLSLFLSCIASIMFLPSWTISLLMNLANIAYTVWICRKAGSSLADSCGLSGPAFGLHMFLLLPMAILLYILAGYLSALSMIFFHNYVSDTAMADFQFLAGALAAYVLMPALSEELLFRGLIFRDMGHNLKGLILSAASFALFHMNFNQMSYAFFMGICFALMAWKTKDLTAGIISHMLFNLISVLFVAFGNSGWVRAAAKLQFAGYAIFFGKVTDAGGGPVLRQVCAGFLVFAAALVLFILLFLVYCHKAGHKKDKMTLLDVENVSDTGEESQEGAGDRKPSLLFFVSCAICLLYALLIEMLA